MKPGGSSLNPYAAAYVPLSKREGSPKPYVQQQQPYVAHGYGAQGMGSFPGAQMSMPMTSPDKKYSWMREEDLGMDMEMDMDIEFLFVTFANLSHESINDVYLANNGDLDATIEMLTQLETYSSEAQEYLPDTLDIGDVPETTEIPSTSTAAKQKNASSEANAPSSSLASSS